MYCSNCANPVDPGDVACPACGYPLQGEKPKYKRRILAGILGILFGGLGLHNFYLGFTGKAMAQLMISLISLGTLSFISVIWGAVEGIRCLTDSLMLDAKGHFLI